MATGDALRQAVALFGGLMAPPREEIIETKPHEYVWHAKAERRDAHFPIIDHSALLRFDTLEAAPNIGHLERVTAKEWAASVWVPEREEYDAVANVLRLYGYYRIHRFDVWASPE